MNMNVQLKKLKNATLDFINSQQFRKLDFGIALRTRKSLCAKGKPSELQRNRITQTLNPRKKGEAL